MSDALTKDQEDAARKIQKLLNLAAGTPNEAEAAAATARAQELLAQYNLSTESVEGHEAGSARREKMYVEGGHYAYQRELWQSVANLNFCICWVQTYRTKGNWRVSDGMGGRTRVEGYRRKHRQMLVGKIVNTKMTVSMAGYLQTVVERITREHLEERTINPLSQWAMSFRLGAVRRICEKLEDKRERALAEERERARRAERASTGASTSTVVALSQYIDKETDANMDFLYGAGWSSKQAAERAARAAKREADIREYTAWAAEHPEEARKKTEEAEARAKKSSGGRRGSGRSSRSDLDYSAYYTGYDAAEGVGVDDQVASPRSTPSRIAAS